MRLLLDTHVWLWMLTAPERLGSDTTSLVAGRTHDLILSAATSWEVTIKYRLGKLPLPSPPHRYIPERMQAFGLEPLPITHPHTLRVAELPDHHGDPFDRLLVAQAQLEDLTLLTVDRMFAKYDVPVRWADD